MTKEEAIRRIKSWNLDSDDMEVLSVVIPELHESEDEKFQKYILKVCKECVEANDEGLELSMSTTKKLLSYLEKQKEKMTAEEYEKSELFQLKLKTQYANGYQDGLVQKEQSITANDLDEDFDDCNDLDEEIHRFFDDCIDVHEAKLYGNISERVIPLDCYELTARHFAKWGEKQKEQKPVRTAKEAWKKMRLEVYAQASGNRHEPNYSNDSTKMFSLCDIDEIFEKIGNSTIGSHPSEWSEEDERMLSRCIKSVECSKQFADSESYKAAKDVEMNWLKSLPERFVLQSKQEWSEEDEEALDMCLEVIPKKWKTKSGILLTKWLKDNIHLQSEQEWSEEVKKKISKLKTFIGQNWFHKENQNKAFDMIDALLPKPHGIQSEKKRHWKPSEKQLIALRYYLNHVPYSSHKEHLSSLRDDCEKLFFNKILDKN